MTTLILIAKEPIPGRVKTRLHPAVSFEQAAELASASIADTIAAASAVSASRRVLYFDGDTTPPGTEEWDVIPQTAGDLDERLAAVFDHVDGPAVLIGMDTPQVTDNLLAPMFRPWPDGVDAWFGPAYDGGFWCLALARPDGALIRGVPMSQDDTGAVQYDRLRAAGLTVALLPTLTDVDTIVSAREVAAIAPTTSFARTLDRIDASTDTGIDARTRASTTSSSSSTSAA